MTDQRGNTLLSSLLVADTIVYAIIAALALVGMLFSKKNSSQSQAKAIKLQKLVHRTNTRTKPDSNCVDDL
jgi:uncharacterized membrane protein